MTEQRRREIQNFIECGNATDQAPSILDAEFPETVWHSGNKEMIYPKYSGETPSGRAMIAYKERTDAERVAHDISKVHETTFSEAFRVACIGKCAWIILCDGDLNEIARYPTR